MKKILKFLRIALAFILVLIGAVVLVLPVFPTVPFLIAAAVVMGRKPRDIIKFINSVTQNIRLYLKRTIRRLRKKRLKNKKPG